MIRVLLRAPGGVKVLLGTTAQDHAKLVHGKALTVDCRDLTETIVEIVLAYKPTQSELLRELAESGLVGPDTDIVQGSAPGDGS